MLRGKGRSRIANNRRIRKSGSSQDTESDRIKKMEKVKYIFLRTSGEGCGAKGSRKCSTTS